MKFLAKIIATHTLSIEAAHDSEVTALALARIKQALGETATVVVVEIEVSGQGGVATEGKTQCA
jgi:hypothetical protein